jgi:hypothetical protein
MNASVLDKEVKAYEKGPFEDLTIQNAITILAVVAAQPDPQKCKGEIRRIETILQKQPIFKENPGETRDRIQKYINELKKADPLRALKRAAHVLLQSGMEEKAFEIAIKVAICDGLLTEGKLSFLKNISSLLSIPESTADRMIKACRAGHRS